MQLRIQKHEIILMALTSWLRQSKNTLNSGPALRGGKYLLDNDCRQFTSSPFIFVYLTINTNWPQKASHCVQTTLTQTLISEKLKKANQKLLRLVFWYFCLYNPATATVMVLVPTPASSLWFQIGNLSHPLFPTSNKQHFQTVRTLESMANHVPLVTITRFPFLSTE